MKRKWFIAVAMVAFAAVATPTVAGATPKPVPTPSAPVTVVSGLHNPRQIAVGPFGVLAVAEAGSGNVGRHDPRHPMRRGPRGSVVHRQLGIDHRHPRCRIEPPALGPPVQRPDVGCVARWLCGGGHGRAVVRADRPVRHLHQDPGCSVPQPLASQNGQLVKFTPFGEQAVREHR